MKFDLRDMDWINSHELLAGAVIPRPIALVGTVGEDGIFNLAPFSFFGVMSVKPAVVYVAIGARTRKAQRKDTIQNIASSRDFTINLVNEILGEPMNQCSVDYPSNVDEFQQVGLTAVSSELVKAPRVKESPVNMECVLRQILEFGTFPESTEVAIGEILRMHVSDYLWGGNAIDMSKAKAIGRLGGQLYCRTTDIFEIKRPYDIG